MENLLMHDKKVSSDTVAIAAIHCDVSARSVGSSNWAPVASRILACTVILSLPIANGAEFNLI
jgi:hypothetical protein